MTSNKYIVKNCPCYEFGFCTSHHIKVRGRINCTDCVMKQVIKKCEYYQNKIGRTLQYRAGFVDATKDILQLFDIEEINK